MKYTDCFETYCGQSMEAIGFIDKIRKISEALLTSPQTSAVESEALTGGKETPLAIYIKIAQLEMKWHEHLCFLLKEEERFIAARGPQDDTAAVLSESDWHVIRVALVEHDAKALQPGAE